MYNKKEILDGLFTDICDVIIKRDNKSFSYKLTLDNKHVSQNAINKITSIMNTEEHKDSIVAWDIVNKNWVGFTVNEISYVNATHSI